MSNSGKTDLRLFKLRMVKECPLLYMSAYPFDPQGIGMHGECETWKLQEGNKPNQWPPAIGRNGSFGRRIKFEDLPADCQRAVIDDYRDYWKI